MAVGTRLPSSPAVAIATPACHWRLPASYPHSASGHSGVRQRPFVTGVYTSTMYGRPPRPWIITTTAAVGATT